MILNIPTLLTLFRLLIIPIIIAVFFADLAHDNLILFGLFLLAASSDWLDGYLARNLNQVTRFGSFLDPVADKILVSISLILLLSEDPNKIFTFAVIIIVAREIIISGLREWMSKVGESDKVNITFLGKLKTALQMFGISFMFYRLPLFGVDVYHIGMILIILATMLTIWSMINYFIGSWPALKKQ